MLHRNINKRKDGLAAMRRMHAAILTFYFQIVGRFTRRAASLLQRIAALSAG